MNKPNTSQSLLSIIFIYTGVLLSFLLYGVCYADIAQMKVYKEAFPDAKPKCANCHSSDKPKKDGDHELNAYGKKVKALCDKPTADTYKQAGTAEDFEKSGGK